MRLVMKAAGKYNPAAIISAGDQCPDPLYSSFYSSLIAVRGNCDRYYEYMGVAFPPVSREMEIYGRRLVITHGDRMSLSDFGLSSGDIFVIVQKNKIVALADIVGGRERLAAAKDLTAEQRIFCAGAGAVFFCKKTIRAHGIFSHRQRSRRHSARIR